MRVRFLAVGRPARTFLPLLEIYLQRIGAFCGVELSWVRPFGGDEALARRRDAEAMLSRVREGEFLYLADERGLSYTSEGFAEEIGALRRRGCPVAFGVGGPSGLELEVFSRLGGRCRVLSLSSMTLQHEVALLVLMEQVYRAFAILEGLPYHRGGGDGVGRLR